MGGSVNNDDERQLERLELLGAGWIPQEHPEETVWKHPESGYLYPQGVAIAMLREGADPGDVPYGPEGGA